MSDDAAVVVSDAWVKEISDTGLIFCAFQADVARQFIPVQRRLAALDLLNTWTTPIGSAVFAIPRECRRATGSPAVC